MVALLTNGGIVAHEGAIAELGKFVEVDNSVITEEKLSAYNGSVFCINNPYTNGQLVILPKEYEIRNILNKTSGDISWRIRFHVLNGSKSVRIAATDGVTMYNGTNTISAQNGLYCYSRQPV